MSADALLERRVPEPVALMLSRYRCLVEQLAPQLLAGLYLYGSLALGAYIEGISDVDLIAVLSREADDEDVSALASAHRTIAKEYPHCAMEVSYLQWRDLGRLKEDIAPYPCYYDGRLHHSAHHDINPVTWWTLKHHGVAVVGPQPESLHLEVTWEDVRAYMVTNLDTYWAAWAASPRRLTYLLTDDGVQWAVLGICRLLYALRMGSMLSKLEAGQYALTQVAERWHGLVQEAVNLRTGSRRRHYRLKLARAHDTAAFVMYMIGLCKADAACPSSDGRRPE